MRGEECLRRDEGGYGPEGRTKRIWRHRGLKEWRRLLVRGQRAPALSGHATARELRDFLGEETWNSYFKFTIERNPWDRAVSRYWWQKHRRERRGRVEFPPIGDYLTYLERERPHWLTNWGHYTIDGRIAVDQVLFYEQLDADLERIRVALRIDGDIGLPKQRAKGNHRPSGSHYREVLGSRERDLISRVCANEIEAFGYVF